MNGAPAAVAVIVAARNEEATIGATLAALDGQDFAGGMDVIVAANGCRDGTVAAVARAARAAARLRIEVLELAEPGKANALAAAERRVPADRVRIFLDADVLLSPNAVRMLAAAVEGPEPKIAAPRKVLRRGRSWGIDACARAWLRLPWVQDEVVGGGALAVGAAGRSRWRELPDVIADDGYLAGQFAPHERLVVRECTAAIRFPPTWRALLRAQRRWIDGGRQLHGSVHRPPFGPRWSGRRRLLAMLHPAVFAAALVVRAVRLAARLGVRADPATAWETPR